MDNDNELRWAEVKASGERLPDFPSVWATASVRTEPDYVRGSLNRHWLLTEFDGTGRLPLNDLRGEFNPDLYTYTWSRGRLPPVTIIHPKDELLFVAWDFEIEYGTDTRRCLELRDFFYDRELSLWYARGADVVLEFPNLRPSRWGTIGGEHEGTI